MTDDDRKVVRTKTASLMTGMSPSWFKMKRHRGDGIPYVQISKRAVGYRVADINAWIEANMRRSTSSPPQQFHRTRLAPDEARSAVVNVTRHRPA